MAKGKKKQARAVAGKRPSRMAAAPVKKRSRAPARKTPATRTTLPPEKSAAPLNGAIAPDPAEAHYLLARRTEDVAAAFVSMAGELWIVKDRLAVLERVLEKHGIPAPELVDRYEPEPEFKARLDGERRTWVRRIISALFPTGLPKVEP